MNLKIIDKGMFESNCYVLWDNKEGVVIDPGADKDRILNVLDKNSISLKYIILTHAHIDHMCSLDIIREKKNGHVVVHQDDAPALSDPLFNGSSFFSGEKRTFNKPEVKVSGGETLEAGNMDMKIIHTPGHSPGCICIQAENCVFTGDTLFKGSIGRTDLGNGSFEDIINSIKSKLMVMDDDMIVYPGHGPSTTIGYERMYNPYIRKGIK